MKYHIKIEFQDEPIIQEFSDISHYECGSHLHVLMSLGSHPDLLKRGWVVHEILEDGSLKWVMDKVYDR